MVVPEKINSSFLISIIVPCYNQGNYLAVALQSVLEQTYINWECIIINDGSSDDTAVVAEQWIRKDNRFKYIQKINGGLSSARNAGLDKATGNLVQFLDADDYLHKQKLEDSIEQLLTKQYDIIVTNYVSFTTDLRSTQPPFYNLIESNFSFESILYKWDFEFAIPIHCGLFPMKYFEDFRFPITLKAKEDWIMWVSVFSKSPKIYFINKPYALYRSHATSMTTDIELMKSTYIEAVLFLKNTLDEKRFDKLVTLFIKDLHYKLDTAKTNLANIKKSKTYRIGKWIRNIYYKFSFLTRLKNNIP